MEKEGWQEKNLLLLSIKTRYGVYYADENQLIVYCLLPLENEEGEKLLNYDNLYLMNGEQYKEFSRKEIEHRACFVYVDKGTTYESRLTMHPSILIIRIDKASNYQSYLLKNDEHLSQFLVWNERGYKEINMYTLIMS